MVTKWKNTVHKGISFLKANRVYVLRSVLVFIALMIFYSIIVYRSWHPTAETIFFGVLANSLLGAGMSRLWSALLEERYGGMWMPEEENVYAKWKEIGEKLEKRLWLAGIIAFLCVCGYMWHLLSGGVWYGGGWYTNYSAGYVMLFTVPIQFVLLYRILIRFRKKELDILMEQMEEDNRERLDKVLKEGEKRLAEALEIERRSVEKVSRSDQLRVDLITNVSHDLKTPLTSMVGYIELIKKEELNDVVRDYVDIISARAEKLKEMINSLFNLAKASSGNIELHPEKLELNRMIEQIFADMDDRIRESGLEFVTQLAKESTELVTDNSYLYRICQNLIENALKYSAKGTRVFVKTSVEEAGQLCMEITNTSGYPMDFTKEDIVERFARGDKARAGDGNGLGLAIVSTYAKALGGEFDIRIDCDQFKARLKIG